MTAAATSARDFDTFDRCERRYAFERRWAPRILSTTALLHRSFDAALGSPDPEGAARAEALRLASTHDILTTALDPYASALHLGALAGIVAYHLNTLHGKLRRALAPEAERWHWDSGVWQDSAGGLHRFALVDHWDEDRLASEAHSWATVAELVVLRQPLQLHGVVVGPARGGRRHSPWTKGLIHPMTRGTVKQVSSLGLRFAPRGKNKTAGFTDAWTSVWREIRTDISTAHWLEAMARDRVLDDLVATRTVRFAAGDARLAAAERDMTGLRERMAAAATDAPMRRTACDALGRGACPFQSVCYAAKAIQPGDLPLLYRERRTDLAEVA